MKIRHIILGIGALAAGAAVLYYLTKEKAAAEDQPASVKETPPAESTENATDPEEEIHEDKPLPKALHDYIDQCFLKYGDTKFDKALAIKETIAYLGLLGYDTNRFDKARAKAQETRDKKEAEAKEKSSV